jgi:hypothetical protein
MLTRNVKNFISVSEYVFEPVLDLKEKQGLLNSLKKSEVQVESLEYREYKKGGLLAGFKSFLNGTHV